MGQTVFVTGDAPPLGAWSVDHAMQLVTSPDKYPMWFSATPVQLAAGRAISYKYMLFSGGDFERWENLDGSRTITPSGSQMRVKDEFDCPSVVLPQVEVAAAHGGAADGVSAAASAGHSLPSVPQDSVEGARVSSIAGDAASTRAGSVRPPELPASGAPGAGSQADHPRQGSGAPSQATLWAQRGLGPGGAVEGRTSSGGLGAARTAHSGLLHPSAGLPGGSVNRGGILGPDRDSGPRGVVGVATGGSGGDTSVLDFAVQHPHVPHSFSEAQLKRATPPSAPGLQPGGASGSPAQGTSATVASATFGSRGKQTTSGAGSPGSKGDQGKGKGKGKGKDKGKGNSEGEPGEEVQLLPGEGVLIVQQRLPVRLSRSEEGDWVARMDEDNLLASKQKSASSASGLRLAWVGLPVSEDIIHPEDQEAVKAALRPHNCHPVFVDPELQQQCLHGFCRDTLWPCFHNVVDVYGEIPTRWWNRDLQSSRWQAYTAFNRLFTQRIIEVYCPGDLVWVHGLSLLLLPSFLKRRLRSASSIGLFLHTPFPSSEVFRTLSVRGEILRGMLAADHVGFHLYEYARHFMAACRRVLGLEHSVQEKGRLAVSYQGRTVLVTLCHAGVEPDLIRYKLALPWVVDAKAGYRSYFADAGHMARRPQAWKERMVRDSTADGPGPSQITVDAPESGSPIGSKSPGISAVAEEALGVIRPPRGSLGVLVPAPRTLAFTDCDRSVLTDSATWLRTIEAKRRSASREIHVDACAEDVLPKALASGAVGAGALLRHQSAVRSVAEPKELLTAFVNMLRRPVEQLGLDPASLLSASGSDVAGGGRTDASGHLRLPKGSSTASQSPASSPDEVSAGPSLTLPSVQQDSQPTGLLMGGSVTKGNESRGLAAIERASPGCPARKLICGIDDADRLGGVTLKLLALEQLLQRVPRLRNRVALLQVVSHTVQDGSAAHAKAIEARSIARRINTHFGRSSGGPVVFLLERLGRPSLENRLALWAASDVWLSTRIRCGLSLDPFEYVLAKTKPAGVVVVSEFDAASRVLGGSLRVNPFRSEEVVAALDLALTMDKEEATARHAVSERFVLSCTTSMWAKRVLLDLKRAQQRVQGIDFQSYGLGLGFRVMGFGENFKSLRIEEVVQAYRNARRRLILTDFGGTLPTQDPDVARRGVALSRGGLTATDGSFALVHGRDKELPLSRDTSESLRSLARDRRNTVFVLSGRDRRVMSNIFSRMPEVGLAAEHGFVFNAGEQSGSGLRSGLGASGTANSDGSRRWQQLLQQFDESWLDVTARVMELYAARTNGAYVSRKPSAVAWNYGNSDKDFGSMQAKELNDHLLGVLAGAPVEVVTGHDSVEVRPRGVNKGAVAWRIMDLAEGVEIPVPVGESADSGMEGGQKPVPTDSGSHTAAMGAEVSTAGHEQEDSVQAGQAASGRIIRGISRGSASSVSSGYQSSRHGVHGASRPGFDFVLAIGDDAADELLFSAIVSRTEQRVLLAGASVKPGLHSKNFAAVQGGPAPPPESASDLRSGPAASIGSGASSVAASQRSDSIEPSPQPVVGALSPVPQGRQSRSGSSFSALSHSHLLGLAVPAAAGQSSPSVASGKGVAAPTYKRPQVFTVTVGKKPSAAGFFVDDQHAVEELLRGLARSTAKQRVHHSMVDLRSVEHAGLSWMGRRSAVEGGAGPSHGAAAGDLAAAGGGAGAPAAMAGWAVGEEATRNEEAGREAAAVGGAGSGWGEPPGLVSTAEGLPVDLVGADAGAGWSSSAGGGMRSAVSMPALTGDLSLHVGGFAGVGGGGAEGGVLPWESGTGGGGLASTPSVGASSGDSDNPGGREGWAEAKARDVRAPAGGLHGARGRVQRQPISGNMVEYFQQIDEQETPLGF